MRKISIGIMIFFFILVISTPIYAQDINDTDIQADAADQVDVGIDNNENTFTDLQIKITTDKDEDSRVYITENYKYNSSCDNIDRLPIVVETDLTIIGDNVSYIDGNNDASGFHVKNGAKLTLKDLIFKNAYNVGGGNGGLITLDQDTTLVLINCVFENNRVHNSNGGVVNAFRNTNVEIYNCTFTKNTCTRDSGETEKARGAMGSVIYVQIGSTLKIYNSTFNNNSGRLATVLLVSHTDGVIQKSTLYIKNCTFENNTSKSNGVVYLDELGTGQILDSVFRNNIATEEDGGALILDAPTSATVNNCTFERNTGIRGGAIQIKTYENNIGNVVIRNSNFIKNQATLYGGAIYDGLNSIAKIYNCNFTENSVGNKNNVKNFGGAIYAREGQLEVYDSNFNKNFVKNYNGGAIYTDYEKVKISNCNFTENYVGNYGGACYIINSETTLSNSNFVKNTAANGGAVYFTKDDDYTKKPVLTLSNSNFNENTATNNGGGLNIREAVLKLSNSNFIKNAGENGGAVYMNNCGSTTVTATAFTQNKASNIGGAIFSKVKNPTSSGCTYVSNSAVKASNVFGSFIGQLSQTKTYYGSAAVAVKLSSPWKMPLSENVRLTFTSGKNSFNSKWFKANSNGVVTVLLPATVGAGKYTVTMSVASGVGYANSLTVKVLKANAKVKYPKSVKKSSVLKVTMKNKQSGKAISGTKFKVKIFTGKKSTTSKIKTTGKGYLKIPTSKLKKGKHKIVVTLKNNFYDVSKTFTVKVK